MASADARAQTFSSMSQAGKQKLWMPMPEDWTTTLPSVATIAATEDRCFKYDSQLGQLGFEKAVTRSRPPSTRGQLYSLWFKN